MDYDINQLRRVVLYIAKEVKRICEENDLRYTLIGGSLIGAVRHKGFIPWDDDFDIVMPRQDYEKFLEICKTQLSPQFSVLNWNTNPNFMMGFSKILLNGTKAVEEVHQNKEYPCQIYIDIFPFDHIPDEIRLRKKQERITYYYKKLLLCKQNGNQYYKRFQGGKRFIYVCLFLLSNFYNRNNLIKKYKEEMYKYDGDKLCYTSIAGSYGYSREIINHSLLENFIQLPFEDTTFSVMHDYDVYLKQVFGDYMELPPIEKRVNHSFICVDFGKYKNI